MNGFSHDTYLSPFTWRYGSKTMRALWSEAYKRRLWRRIWVALARAQMGVGLVSAAQVDDLAQHVDQIDIIRAEAIEAEIHHDLMAEVRTFAEQCTIGGGIIHWGATSADVEDNADVLRIREAIDHVSAHVRVILRLFSNHMRIFADVPTMAFTHIQPAEPTTVGYRMALYAQDLLSDYESLLLVRERLRGKGFKGAVGTSAAYADLLYGTGITPAAFESNILKQLDLQTYPITSQTYPRKQDWDVLNALAGIAQSVHKFAFDVRLLQSPVIGEWHEPFAAKQVGSSAMPFKRNPIHSEKIDSLARLVAGLPAVAWSNAALSLLERTLDDSANRRELLPTAFLAVDELLRTTERIVRGLRIDTAAIERNFERFAIFSATERVLMACVRQGADRQALHDYLREESLRAWAQVAIDGTNPLARILTTSDTLHRYLSPDAISALLDARMHVGDAPDRTRALADVIDRAIEAQT